MDLKSIIAISGMSGLYKALSQSRTGVIVESLQDKKRTMVSASQKISSLDNISVFTTSKDLPLSEVLQKIKETIQVEVEVKHSAEELRNRFTTVLPDFDPERVRDSDIKKIFSWYNILLNIPEVWVEAPAETEEGEAAIKSALDKNAEKPRHINQSTGRVNTHGAQSRSAIPQKKGGS